MTKQLLPLVLAAMLSALGTVHAQQAGQISGATSADPNAAAAAVLTEDMAAGLALQANPEVLAAMRELEASRGALQQAGTMRNPELVAEVEDRRRETRTTTIQVNQPFEIGGQRGARVLAAERARDIAEAEVRAKRAEIRARLSSAFFDVQGAQERHRLARASVELAGRASAAAAKRVAAGKISPVEATRARVAEAGARVELVQAESELASARSRLAAFWGAGQARFGRVAGDSASARLPEIPAWQTLAERLARSPRLALAQLEVAHRQALTQVERSRRIPDITLSLGAKRDEELGRDQAIIGVSIPLPLFDRNRGNVQQAVSLAYKAIEELRATEIALESELRQAYARLTGARSEAQLYQQEILPGAQSAYEAASKGFEFGKFGFLDVLDAQRTLFQATTHYLHAVSEAHRAAADIERIVGGLESMTPLEGQ